MAETPPPIIDEHVREPTRAVPFEQPYGAGGPLRPPHGKGRVPLWLKLLVLGFVGFSIGVLALGTLGLNILTDEVCAILTAQPVVSERLGDNLSCDMAWLATSMDERMDYFHYEATGSKGTGIAILHTEPDGPNGEEVLIDGTLTIDGVSFPLLP